MRKLKSRLSKLPKENDKKTEAKCNTINEKKSEMGELKTVFVQMNERKKNGLQLLKQQQQVLIRLFFQSR